MNTCSLYLRPDIVVEPLVDQWYAWSHLISPATAAMNISQRHIPIMQSYISSPQLHAAAVQNPKMLGGPYIDYGGGRVREIMLLLEKTRTERQHMLKFCEAVHSLAEILELEAVGYSLEPLYAKVPELLRGYVELTYDLNNHPSFRFIEPLLYKSCFYNPSSQSLKLSVISGDDRPFSLSTPRLEDRDSFHLRIPFNHDGVDVLCRMKTKPRSFSSLVDALGIGGQEDILLRSMLTECQPSNYERYQAGGVRWRYFGHACILIETGGVSVLLDPVLSYTYESDVSRYTYADLPDVIDYVLITHNHQDHILFETILQLRHKVGTVVVPRSGGGELQDPSLRLLLQNVGFRNVLDLSEMEAIEIDNGCIVGLPFLGEHADLDIRSKLAYYVRIGKHSLLFAADSCNVEPRLYEHIHSVIGDVDALFLGMECDGAPLSWLYGPLLTKPLDRKMDQSRRLAGSNYERSRRIVDDLHCSEVYVYAMGQEPWLNYVMSLKYTEESNPIVASNNLIAECLARGITAERLFGEKEILLP